MNRPDGRPKSVEYVNIEVKSYNQDESLFIIRVPREQAEENAKRWSSYSDVEEINIQPA